MSSPDNHWTETRRIYDQWGGCGCHSSPPCSFCAEMTEDETDAYCDLGIAGLEALWKQHDLIAVLAPMPMEDQP